MKRIPQQTLLVFSKLQNNSFIPWFFLYAVRVLSASAPLTLELCDPRWLLSYTDWPQGKCFFNCARNINFFALYLTRKVCLTVLDCQYGVQAHGRWSRSWLSGKCGRLGSFAIYVYEDPSGELEFWCFRVKHDFARNKNLDVIYVFENLERALNLFENSRILSGK